MIKARVGKGVSQEWNTRVTFHAPKNVGKCEGMNPHTPKWAPTLEVGVPMDPKSSKSDCRGQNSLDWRVPYITENFWNADVKNGFAWPIWVLKT